MDRHSKSKWHNHKTELVQRKTDVSGWNRARQLRHFLFSITKKLPISWGSMAGRTVNTDQCFCSCMDRFSFHGTDSKECKHTPFRIITAIILEILIRKVEDLGVLIHLSPAQLKSLKCHPQVADSLLNIFSLASLTYAVTVSEMGKPLSDAFGWKEWTRFYSEICKMWNWPTTSFLDLVNQIKVDRAKQLQDPVTNLW